MTSELIHRVLLHRVLLHVYGSSLGQSLGVFLPTESAVVSQLQK